MINRQQLSLWFRRSVIAAYGLALLISLWRVHVSGLGVPFLLLILIAVQTNLRYSLPIPRLTVRVPLTEGFALLAILLFGGDAAILFATATALYISLRHDKDPENLLFNASLMAMNTFCAFWIVRLIYGPVLEPAAVSYSLSCAQAVCLTALIQTLGQSIRILFGEASQLNQKLLAKARAVFLWSALACVGGAVAAVLLATIIFAVGFNLTVIITLISALGLIAWQTYLKNMTDRAPQVERYGANLRESSERFRSAFDHASIGMALVSPEGRWLQVNRSLCNLLGYSERELMSTDYLTITHRDELSAAVANIKQLLKGKIPSYQMEKRYIHKEGHEVWVLWNVSLAHDPFTKTPHLIFQIQDITDRKRAEARLLHDAFHDALTGLPNRALFMDHLKLAIARLQRRDDQMFAVFYLDLDRFKIINDSLGHMIGDQLLVAIARRLEECLRPGDTIARLGGDEFTVLVEDIKTVNDALYIADRIAEELSVPFTLGGREVFTTVSIGIALSSKDYERAETILRDADTAMYRAKSLGKSRCEVFDNAMHDQAIKLLQVETDLRRAVENSNEFFVLYQPIISLQTAQLRGFEALIRWRHPERGLISPVDFIPVAEETGLILQIGEWVLREACRQMSRWQSLFPSDPSVFMSVNLSGKQFAQQNLIQEVAYILSETRLAPQSLKLEITESVVMENIETATDMLKELRSLGVQLSIDDFGTGYSSLSYLHRFPINTLKIDRSFVTQMIENDENTEIVRTVIMLAQNLGMDVVAEGVETTEQLSLLRRLGCEYGQGYLFSKPIDAETAENFIARAYSQAPSTSLTAA